MPKQTITPGEWRVMDGAVVSDTILEYGGFVVCSLGREATTQDKANLLKQAAVPDMIEAIEQVITALQWSIPEERMTPEEMAETLGAALRKAGQID